MDLNAMFCAKIHQREQFGSCMLCTWCSSCSYRKLQFVLSFNCIMEEVRTGISHAFSDHLLVSFQFGCIVLLDEFICCDNVDIVRFDCLRILIWCLSQLNQFQRLCATSNGWTAALHIAKAHGVLSWSTPNFISDLSSCL